MIKYVYMLKNRLSQFANYLKVKLIIIFFNIYFYLKKTK